jgi:hypothetical protein
MKLKISMIESNRIIYNLSTESQLSPIIREEIPQSPTSFKDNGQNKLNDD